MLLICILFDAVRFHYDATVMRLYNVTSRSRMSCVYVSTYQVTKFMPQPLMQQQPPQQPQQQRPRFEHPQQNQGMLGRGGVAVGGPGGENQRMPGMPNNREEYFDPKRMRRF